MNLKRLRHFAICKKVVICHSILLGGFDVYVIHRDTYVFRIPRRQCQLQLIDYLYYCVERIQPHNCTVLLEKRVKGVKS